MLGFVDCIKIHIMAFYLLTYGMKWQQNKAITKQEYGDKWVQKGKRNAVLSVLKKKEA